MNISLTRMDPAGSDREALMSFMTANEFPFHMRPRPSASQVASSIEDGSFDDEDTTTYWIEHSELGRIGTLALEDLTDTTPLFDLRLDSKFRGRGLGTGVLRAATDHVFKTMDVNRFEGQTREDNVAMRAVFLKSGWVKEAHYREGWPVDGGTPVASVAYAILRRDWENGTLTPVPWDDFTIDRAP